MNANTQAYPTVQKRAWLTPRSFVSFVNVRPDKANGDWICDECLERVTPAKFESHASGIRTGHNSRKRTN